MIYNAKPNVKMRYFTLPNSIFRLGLEGGEILVYAFLLYCEDRKTYTCYSSYSTVGSAVGMSKNTVKKYVKGLEKKRLITTEPTTVRLKNGQVRNGNLLYHIRPIEEAENYYDEWQMRQNQIIFAQAQAKKRLEEYDRKHPQKTAEKILKSTETRRNRPFSEAMVAYRFEMVDETQVPPGEHLYPLNYPAVGE